MNWNNFRTWKKTVLNIFKTIGARDISSYDIAACHCLGKRRNSHYPAKVIERFLNRKNAHIIHQNKKHLIKCKDSQKLSNISSDKWYFDLKFGQMGESCSDYAMCLK